jgi:hypothetical protein
VTALFGIPLLIGLLLMMVWIAATAVAGTVEGWENVDPEHRFGRSGRFVLAGVIGFGMAGISALYAGWPHLLAVGAGAAGGIGLVFVSTWLGPDSDT